MLVGDVVDNLIGESVDRNAPSTSLGIEYPNVRLGLNERRRGCHVTKNSAHQARMALLVPVYRRRELFTCGRMVPKATAHQPRTSRSILRLVSSQDSSSAEPDSRASTRRLISASHAKAASELACALRGYYGIRVAMIRCMIGISTAAAPITTRIHLV